MDDPGALQDSAALHDMKDAGELTPAEEAMSQAERDALEGVVWKKLDRWILPVCTGFFLLAFLVCL